ncbi:DNA polymerase III subunit gamma/tau [Morganella morganii subsp. sibonii]
MSYQVLARKWRPQTFSQVIGQQHVLTALANGLEHQRLHHAYLFSGTRGVGKTTLARLFAKGLNCEQGITATPCGKCQNCLEIEQGRFVDLIEIDAASRTKVEDTRELLDNVQYAPSRGRFKVYLIDEVHMLSRHSFNALLKTLEEPPEHVKFLLATTDPQKLPVTILSRCLQFHLKALDVDQISQQLDTILTAEQIENDARARLLLARAADGSMRDALSLADQAIALGAGKVTTEVVTQMLGTLDDEQPLTILEALVKGDGVQVMNGVNDAASRGADWDNLLTEMLAALHKIAMLQLLPVQENSAAGVTEERLRILARAIAPADLQLYYQTLLVGRKELPYAPDRRMGAEMALLRALAFHPRNVIDEVITAPSVAPVSLPSQPQTPEPAAPARSTPPPVVSPETENSPTAQLLKARDALNRQETPPSKKSEPVTLTDKVKPANSALERLAAVTENRRGHVASAPQPKASGKPQPYQWRPQKQDEPEEKTPVTRPKDIKKALEHEKTPEVAEKLAVVARERDVWAADIDKMQLPKLVQQLALNAVKEQTGEDSICLHLRSSQRHLNSKSAHSMLSDALSELYGKVISLTICEDDDVSIKTPLEWRQAIYEEMLAQARQSIVTDKTIQTLLTFFDAELDEESIRPV